MVCAKRLCFRTNVTEDLTLSATIAASKVFNARVDIKL